VDFRYRVITVRIQKVIYCNRVSTPRLPFSAFPFREGARIDSKLMGELLLRQAAGFPVSDQTLGKAVAGWQGIVTQELNDSGDVA
jgi:hypothetical protein